MVVFRLMVLPLRLALGVMGLSFRLGFGTARLLGLRRLLWLTVGLVVGLLVAPVPGRQLRARIRELAEPEPAAPPIDMASTVGAAPLPPRPEVVDPIG